MITVLYWMLYSKSNPEFILVAVIIIIIAVIYSFFFSRKAIVKSWLGKTPKKSLSDFKDGDLAKVIGEIKYLGKPLRAPLSGRKCAYYYVLVEKESQGKSSSWVDWIEEEVAGEFIIKDGVNYAMVETSKVKTYLVQDREYSSGFLNDATPDLEKYLNKHGKESTGLMGMNRALRYKEGILEEGEMVAVSGRGYWKHTDKTDMKGPSGKVLVIRSEGDDLVYLSDDPDTVS